MGSSVVEWDSLTDWQNALKEELAENNAEQEGPEGKQGWLAEWS